MQDNIPDTLIAAFERKYDTTWNDPQLRNERLAMRYGWAAAMEAKPCLHQIQEPAPVTAIDALREAEAALEVAMARILKADPGHSICVTSEAKALVAVRQALSAQAAPVAVGERTDLYPGVMRCAKCEFQLVRAVLSVQSGKIHAGDSKTEPCPNGCGPLWPVTYNEYAKQAMDSADAMADRAIAAEKEVETLRAALAATPADHSGDATEMVQETAPVVLPENIREGDPYDNPEFEQLARDLGVWGTPQSAIGAQFWMAARNPAAPVALSEPDFWVRPGATIHPDRGWQCWSNDGTATGAFHADTVRALLAGVSAPAAHPDDAAVDALAALMKAKLAKQRAKGYGGWDMDCTRERLSELLRGHVDKGDPVDVANFCAFLSARGEGIAPQAQADARDAGEFWGVLSPCGEGVFFRVEADARWTHTGHGSGSDGFGVPTIGEAFRESYEDDELELVRVHIAAQAAQQGGAA